MFLPLCDERKFASTGMAKCLQSGEQEDVQSTEAPFR